MATSKVSNLGQLGPAHHMREPGGFRISVPRKKKHRIARKWKICQNHANIWEVTEMMRITVMKHSWDTHALTGAQTQ